MTKLLDSELYKKYLFKHYLILGELQELQDNILESIESEVQKIAFVILTKGYQRCIVPINREYNPFTDLTVGKATITRQKYTTEVRGLTYEEISQLKKELNPDIVDVDLGEE